MNNLPIQPQVPNPDAVDKVLGRKGPDMKIETFPVEIVINGFAPVENDKPIRGLRANTVIVDDAWEEKDEPS